MVRMVVQHDQFAAGLAQCTAECLDGRPDELDASVRAEPARQQRIEDAAVEHEGTEDLAAMAQGIMQRCVVDVPQIAPEPDQPAPEMRVDAIGAGLRGG